MEEIQELETDEVNQIIRDVVEKIVGDETAFMIEKLKKWSDTIVQQCLEKLAKLKRPFKFIVTSVINQRNGAGFVSHSSCFFNIDTDLVTTFRWENDILHCVVSVYALAVF